MLDKYIINFYETMRKVYKMLINQYLSACFAGCLSLTKDYQKVQSRKLEEGDESEQQP